jgi:predicted transcriptional regulator
MFIKKLWWNKTYNDYNRALNEVKIDQNIKYTFNNSNNNQTIDQINLELSKMRENNIKV